MNIQELLLAIDGQATIVAPDGAFLGVLSTSAVDPSSISNPAGIYGSNGSIYSIRNRNGNYGSINGLFSPYNPNCIMPPTILLRGQPLTLLTQNYALASQLPKIDPDFVLSFYQQVSHYDSACQTLLDSYNQNRATSAWFMSQTLRF
ncbi:MAG: hypothetical protein KME52_11920 [Desmonostoc geniculatum HA4340-LM1]|jgi:predicted dehydrogenase|nr:hypothetical protein [Desmonostoc geniculatum HA4340-LM1]